MRIVVYISTFALFLMMPLASYASEYLNSFESDIHLSADSSLAVTEQIEYVTTEPRHGIIRTILRHHPDTSSGITQERYIDIDVIAVTRDNAVVPYVVTKGRDDVTIKIGDPATTATGTTKYQINYTVTGAISYIKNGGADLYWNVTGNEWTMPIRSATARVSADVGIFRNERSCYFGTFGEASSCKSLVGDNGVVVYTVRDLQPGEGLTIAQAVEQTSIERVILERWKPLWLWVPGLLVWFLVLGFYVYRYRTANETGRSIIPQYDPYPNVKPMYTGLLFDGRLDSRDITAGIVYLAEQGYIKISKIARKVMFFFEVDDFEIMLAKIPDATVDAFSRTILTLVLGKGYVVGKKVSLTELRQLTQTESHKKHQLLTQLRSELSKDLETNGFFTVTKAHKKIIIRTAIAFLTIIPIVGLLQGIIPLTMAPFVIGAVFTLIILAFVSRQRTRKGFEALDHLKGFKLFLETTDKDRFDFHNAPEKSPEQFMEYLPYAIAFGVEEKWAEVFKDIAIPVPQWYSGDTTTFNASGLTQSLGAFSTAFAASSSASGASSGGGFSGGGAGGGGGSSW